MKRYKVFDIDWDTVDQKVHHLPSEAIIDIEDDQDVSLDGADVLSNEYGWCVNSFIFEELL